MQKSRDILVLSFISIMYLSCNYNVTSTKENYDQLVPDTLICNTLNYFVDDTLIYEFRHTNRFLDRVGFDILSSDDSLRIIKLDTIFSKIDLDFIFKQNLNSKYYKVNKCIRNKEFIAFDTLEKFERQKFWEHYLVKFGKKSFCTICKPLFSKDYKYVIIKYSNNCGYLCGSGATVIYKRENNKWIKILCLHDWIS